MPRRFHGDQRTHLLPNGKAANGFENCKAHDGEARHDMAYEVQYLFKDVQNSH